MNTVATKNTNQFKTPDQFDTSRQWLEYNNKIRDSLLIHGSKDFVKFCSLMDSYTCEHLDCGNPKLEDQIYCYRHYNTTVQDKTLCADCCKETNGSYYCIDCA